MSKFKPTGFYAFWFEQVIEHYIIDINSKIQVDTGKKLPHKNKFANMWNSAYSSYPGSANYLEFEKNVLPSRKEYFRCFLYYYAKNANKWKVNHIIDDDFKLYYEMEIQYNDLRSTFNTDLQFIISLVQHKNMTFSAIFYSKTGLPIIYKLFFRNKITVFSLVIFENLFGIFSKLNIKNLNFIDETKLNTLRIIFDNFYSFIYNKNINWINIVQERIKYLNQ